MTRFLSLWRKELAGHFLSPVAYTVLTAFLAVTGLGFWRLAAQSDESPMGLSVMLFGPVFFWLMILVVITAITMRLFAEERRAGTLETLRTAPLRDAEIVLGKFAGAYTFFLIACASTAAPVACLRFLAPGAMPLDPGPLAAGYLILALCGAFYIAIGLFVSSLTRHQVVAAVVCFAVLATLFFMEYLNYFLPGSGAQAVLAYLTPTRHIMDFASGFVDSRPIVWYLTGTALMLFLATKAVESERWR